jgi:hypothetical protein
MLPGDRKITPLRACSRRSAALTALLVLREQIIRPLLAASGQPQPPSKPVNPTPIDNHYENLRAGMQSLFNELGLAA